MQLRSLHALHALHSWGLARRRAYLQQELGFVCGCERCVVEEDGGCWETCPRAKRRAAAAAATAAAAAAEQAEAQAAVSAAEEPECLEDMLEDWQLAALEKAMRAKAVADRLEEVVVVEKAEEVEEVDEAEQIEKIEEEVVTGREAEAIVRPAEAEEAEEVVEQRQQPVRPELRPVYESEVAEAKTGHRITAAAALALVTVVAAIAWRRRA